MSDLSEALREVSARMSFNNYDTSVESAFLQLAKVLERREKNLDPEPYLVSLTRRGEVVTHRSGSGAPAFFGMDRVEFDPRPQYEQDETKYE